MKRSTPLARTGRLRPVSKRRRRELSELAVAVEQLKVRSGGRCEAVLLPHLCSGRGEHPHHVQRRNRRNHVVGNLLHVCFEGHRMIHANPDLAREVGYLRSSFARRVD